MDVHAVGADAGLARVAELREGDLLGRLLEVRVLEDEEGRVAAQLQRHALERLGRLGVEQPAHVRGPGEGQLPDARVLYEHPRGGDGIERGQDLEGPRRTTGLLPQPGPDQRGER